MAGFTKLVPEIVQSSIWNESSDVRIVWITMLAIKDENGYVRGSEQTLSRLANVSIVAVNEAIEKFTSPDKYSCTPDNEGRRIARCDGGFMVLNHAKYRANEFAIREQNRERAKRFRERKKEEDIDIERDVTLRNVTVTLPSASASVSVDDRGVGKEEKKYTFKTMTEQQFIDECNSQGILDNLELQKFVSYWSEKSASGKMRFQLQKTWETSRRIATWKNNSANFSKGKQVSKPFSASDADERYKGL